MLMALGKCPSKDDQKSQQPHVEQGVHVGGLWSVNGSGYDFSQDYEERYYNWRKYEAFVCVLQIIFDLEILLFKLLR